MAESAWRGTYDDIVASAMRTTGLSDLGGDERGHDSGDEHGNEHGDDPAEGLRLLVADYAGAAGLTEAGAKRMRGGLKGLLAARLMAEQGFAARPDHADVAIRRPVFVTGLPRSGTTLLQRLLTADPAHQGLEQWLADLPQPRPPRETWDDDPVFSMMQQGYHAFHEANPELAGIHYSDATTHEECWRLLQQAGRSVAFETQALVPSYAAWLREQDWSPAYARHRRLLQLIGADDAERRWVLKNPSHLAALDALTATYPDAIVLVTHRDPVTCVASMCSLAEASTRGTSSVFTGEVIGRTQLDLLAWEQERARAAILPSGVSVVDVDYDDLVGDPLSTVAGVYAATGMPWDDAVAAAVGAELDRSRSGVRAPRHAYDLADHGLTEAQVREVLSD